MTEVVNKRDRLYDVYIGRGSLWGNPFTVEQYGRDVCIELYENYIREKLRIDSDLRNELMKLDGKVLGCFCKPKRCHGDVLVRIIEEIKNVPVPQR